MIGAISSALAFEAAFRASRAAFLFSSVGIYDATEAA
jgi:hypothetical protein